MPCQPAVSLFCCPALRWDSSYSSLDCSPVCLSAFLPNLSFWTEFLIKTLLWQNGKFDEAYMTIPGEKWIQVGCNSTVLWLLYYYFFCTNWNRYFNLSMVQKTPRYHPTPTPNTHTHTKTHSQYLYVYVLCTVVKWMDSKKKSEKPNLAESRRETCLTKHNNSFRINSISKAHSTNLEPL